MNMIKREGGGDDMHKRRLTTIALSFLMMLLSVSPAYAGTWTEHDDGTWTYLNDDGESVDGWIEEIGRAHV